MNKIEVSENKFMPGKINKIVFNDVFEVDEKDTLDIEVEKINIKEKGNEIKNEIKYVRNHISLLIFSVVISIIWTALKAIDLENVYIKVLNYITFSNKSSDMLSYLTGNLIGKFIYASFILGMVTSIRNRRSSNKKLDSSLNLAFKKLETHLNSKNKNSIGNIFIGIGTTFIIQNFITGNVSFDNTIICLIFVIISLNALIGEKNFIRKISNFINKNILKRDSLYKEDIEVGFVIGNISFIVLSIINSIFKISYIGYIIGLLIILVSIFVFDEGGNK